MQREKQRRGGEVECVNPQRTVFWKPHERGAVLWVCGDMSGGVDREDAFLRRWTRELDGGERRRGGKKSVFFLCFFLLLTLSLFFSVNTHKDTIKAATKMALSHPERILEALELLSTHMVQVA